MGPLLKRRSHASAHISQVDYLLAKCRNGFSCFNLFPRAIPLMLGCGSSLGDVLLVFFFSFNSRLHGLNVMKQVLICQWLFWGLFSHFGNRRHCRDVDSRGRVASLWISHTIASTFVAKSMSKPLLAKRKPVLSSYDMCNV